MISNIFKSLSRKINFAIVAVLVIVVTAPLVTVLVVRGGRTNPVNIILMIPDGMSLSATTLARFMQPDNPNDPEEDWTFTGRRRLALDEHVQGLVRTAWVGGPITDSAPAATAMATGHKSNNLRVGLDKNDDPRATVMQAARSIGMSTGLVMTSEFMHATPAAFMSHEYARFNYDNLARQMLANRPNVVLGTGSNQARSFNVYRRGFPEMVTINCPHTYDTDGVRPAFPEVRVSVRVADIVAGNVPHHEIRIQPGVVGERYTRVYDRRLDGSVNPLRSPWGQRLMNERDGYALDSSRRRIVEQNTWMQQVAEEGYQIVRTRSQMNRLLRPTSANAADLRVWGDFNGGLTMLGENYRYLSFDIDRRHRPDLDEPSLAEMTKTAIDLLSTNRNGFFLVVEGSKVDWAAHVHDAVGLMSDVLAFDRAFQVALDFAKRDGNTIVIVASDHATGGLTIGSSDLSFNVPGQDNTGPWTFDEAPWEMLAPLRQAVRYTGRSAEAAIQLFVLGRERVIHRGQPGGSIDFAANHNQVLAAYGIDWEFWDYYAAKSDAELDAIAGYLLKEHRTTPTHIRNVHKMIEDFRDAHTSTGVQAEPGQEHFRGNGMQFLSSTHLQNAQRQLGGIMNRISFIRFATNWHSGDDVPFYMYAPRGMSHQELLGRRGNHIDNTDIAHIIANALGVNLDSLTNNLFVEIFNDGKSVIPGITVEFESARFQSNLTREGVSDQNNGSSWVDVVFTVTRGNRKATVTAGTNYFIINQNKTRLDNGVIVYIISKPQFIQPADWIIRGANAESGRLFVPRQLIRALGG